MNDENTINIGALGPWVLPQGLYGYIGSAMGPGGIAARVRRHFRRTSVNGDKPRPKRLHWHIDYVLEQAEIITAIPFPLAESPKDPRNLEFEPEGGAGPGAKRLECVLAEHIRTSFDALIPIPGFGTSDCRCCSHLFSLHFTPSARYEAESLQRLNTLRELFDKKYSTAKRSSQ